MSKTTLILLVALLLLSSLMLIGHNSVKKEEIAEKSSVPWRVQVLADVFFVSAAAGSSLVVCISTFLKNSSLGTLTRRALWMSLVALLPAPLSIILEIGRPDHALWMIAGFNPNSRVAWMPVLYTLFGLVTLVWLIKSIREKESSPSLATLMLVVTAALVDAALITNLGQLFGESAGVPAWLEPHMGIFFMVCAIPIGAALQLLLLSLASRKDRESAAKFRELASSFYPKLFVASVALVAIMEIWLLIHYYYNYRPMFEVLVNNELSASFWIGEVVLWLLLPLTLSALAAKVKSVKLSSLAALSILIGGFISRYNLIIGGQIARVNYDWTFVVNPYKAQYAPVGALQASLPEVLMLIGTIAAWLFVYALGELLLALDPSEETIFLVFRKSLFK